MNVIFKSINQGDVVQAAEHGVWQHSQNALQVEVGDSVYVFPTQAAAELVNMDTDDRLVLTAKLDAVAPPFPMLSWLSKGNYPSNTYLLADCKLVRYSEMPEEIRAANNNTQNSIAYLE